VRVFDSENAALGPPKDVYINRGRIAAIYDAGSPNQSAATAAALTRSKVKSPHRSSWGGRP
jgi:hypothetical protein